ncbi:tripartite tricarboxylate transporter substrate binding protein [Piscinibacter sp. XHJ-5]|uniref:Bug family tripartite tricarboxylate transporter substrate binding protein n=1 Tax=Piscinibacter sp. XHJ-5 TaxID=3037797 RepID=UPI00245345A3|nr:tripartite tricarboxylate transporter substrate binding protein [Piscinibacter sp. XHJ-5]
MRFFLSGRWAVISACLASFACAPASYAQDTRPLRVIVPNQAGSGVDTIARAMSNAMASTFGRSVVIENLPGSGGMTGTVQIVNAPKDGSAIGIVSSNHVINPFIYKKMPFDSIKDITPITVIASGPVVLVVNPDQVKAKTTQEFIAELRAKAKEFSYGSAGNGTVLHLAAEYLNSEAKIDVTHVPYKGTGALTADLIGGQVQYAMLPLSTALPHVKAGKLRAIGVSSTSRSSALPDVPTLAESGLPGFSFDAWIAVIGPAGMPSNVVNETYSKLKAVLATREVQEAIHLQGMEIVGNTPAQFGPLLVSELEKHGRLVKRSGATAN